MSIAKPWHGFHKLAESRLSGVNQALLRRSLARLPDGFGLNENHACA
ncbi:MAG: hypothetical protein M5U05_09355 [Anaerolineales bacterium]|nr:hypothetical protein [Anaerolineales bacterium]